MSNHTDILVCLFSQRYNMGRRTNQPDFLMEVAAMIVLKILAAPVMVALSLLAAMVTFLFCVASAVCELGCIVLTLLSLILFIGGQTVGGIVFLILAFLVSPFGVPAIAEWLVDKLHSAKFALRDFITGRYFGTKCPKAGFGEVPQQAFLQPAGMQK